MRESWGLLGPESLPSARRVRTLGLAAAVRRFNELAVPGIGGVWYAKRLLLATLGVVVAESARDKGAKVHNIEVANAIEALASLLAYRGHAWRSEARLRGRTKLQDRGDDVSFERVRKRGFYVTQPMRMGTVQALPGLGLVKSGAARFNAFQSSESGLAFVAEACAPYRPFGGTVVDQLTNWVVGKQPRIATPQMSQALSPLIALGDASRRRVRELLVSGGASGSFDARLRRRSALTWVGMASQRAPDWRRAPEIESDEHWHDLEAGAAFFSTRDAALATLDVIESAIGYDRKPCAVDIAAARAGEQIAMLQESARRYLEFEHDDSEARAFGERCAVGDPSRIVRELVERDGRVLRLTGDDVRPAGPAFRGSPVEQERADGEDDGPLGRCPLPPGISYRMRNLYLLHLDMEGQLDAWLTANQAGGSDDSE